MKISLITNRKLLCLAIICLVIGMASKAHAVSQRQLLRVLENQTITGKCCFSWNETVSVQEPVKLVPVVVTWSTDFIIFGAQYLVAGISLNGGPCQFFGPAAFQQPINIVEGLNTDTRTFDWIIQPTDGLRRGNNTFTVCGGGLFADTETMTLGFNTLQVRLSK
jgi:hypothetical protein